jgi:hypothetical protein
VDLDRNIALGLGSNTYVAATINSCCQESIPSVPITPAPAPSSPPSIQEEEQQKEGKDKIVSKKNLHHRLRLQTMRTQPTIRIFNSTMSRYWI